MTSAVGGARQAQRRLEPVARAGYAVSGLLHVLIGALAVRLALGGGGGETDQSGALGAVARTPGGQALLWVATLALVALTLWRVLDAVVEARGHEGGEAAKDAATAVVYAALAATAATFARGSSTSSEGRSDDVTASLMGAPGGRLLVGAIGLAVLGVGAYHVVKGVTARYREDLGGGGGSGVRRFADVAGRVGYPAKGVALGVVGVLFVVAAVRHRAQDAGGLDAALRALLSLPAGPVLLVVVGVGLAAYGVFAVARARLGRL